MAKRNKVELDEGKIDAMVATVVAEKEAAKDEAKASILDLFRGRKLCFQTLIICFLWMVNSGTYYGLALRCAWYLMVGLVMYGMVQYAMLYHANIMLWYNMVWIQFCLVW